MATLPVARMGNPILRKKAKPVKVRDILSLKIQTLIDDMIETMHHESGVGLAAPQVSQSLQIAVIEFDLSENSRYKIATSKKDLQPLMVFINPKVKILDSKKTGFWEGCLSVPGLRGWVERPKKIRVSYLDRDGKKCTLKAQGFLATVFQHEFDHLNGILYVDKVKDRNKLGFMEEFEQFHLGT